MCTVVYISRFWKLLESLCVFKNGFLIFNQTGLFQIWKYGNPISTFFFIVVNSCSGVFFEKCIVREMKGRLLERAVFN